MRYLIASLAALLLLGAGSAEAQSVWNRVDSSDNANPSGWSGSPTRAVGGETYRTTLTGTVSSWFNVEDCAVGSTYDAVNLFGASVNIQKCAASGCANPITLLSTPLADGTSLEVTWRMKWIRVSAGTSGDVAEFFCAARG